MAENKTKATDASVDDYIASRANEQQEADVRKLMTMMKRITRKQPKMWGPSIVGYGNFGCLYFKRLSDLDTSVLEQLITNSMSEAKRRYGLT